MAAIFQTGEINRLTRVSVTESILRKFPMPHKKWGACACANSGYKALFSGLGTRLPPSLPPSILLFLPPYPLAHPSIPPSLSPIHSSPFSHSFLPTLEYISLSYVLCLCHVLHITQITHSPHMHTHHRIHPFFNICNALRGIGKREREGKERKMEDGG